ncbi:acylphosphatase [Chloroflexota bacterium]
MRDLSSFQATAYGRVQGVYYRAFASRQARELGLGGYARNLPGGQAVEIHAEGEIYRLESLLERLKVGPPGARVDRLESHWVEYTGAYSDFTIR